MSQVQQLRRERNINTQQFTLLKVNTAEANAMLDDRLQWAQIAYMKMLFCCLHSRVLHFPQTKEERDQLAHRGAKLKQTMSKLEVYSSLAT